MVSHGVKVFIGELEIVADGYIPVPEETAVQFYRDTTFDHFPPINVCDNALSDFGRLVLTGSESEDKR